MKSRKPKILGAFTFFVGTPADRRIIRLTTPSYSLPEVCDLTIYSYGTSREDLVNFDAWTSKRGRPVGITSVLIFHVLNLEIAEKISEKNGAIWDCTEH